MDFTYWLDFVVAGAALLASWAFGVGYEAKRTRQWLRDEGIINLPDRVKGFWE